ncbi:DUF5983 family protein [Sphingomonas oryzagri]
MRRVPVCACSTSHLPIADREAIDQLIQSAPIRDGRILIDHPTLSIEPRRSGFSVHLGLFDDHPGRPDDVSSPTWALMLHARREGAAWLVFDADEPVSNLLPIYPTEEGEKEEAGEGGEPISVPAFSPASRRITIRCTACGSGNVMRDAWATWDDEAQDWVLGALFDAAFCEDCETDGTLVEQPLVQTEIAA